jgi:hypothetical protein
MVASCSLQSFIMVRIRLTFDFRIFGFSDGKIRFFFIRKWGKKPILIPPVVREEARVAARRRAPPRGVAAAAGRSPANIHRITFPLSAGTWVCGEIGIVRVFRSCTADRRQKASSVVATGFLATGVSCCT